MGYRIMSDYFNEISSRSDLSTSSIAPESLEKDCREALKQIDNQHYMEVLHREGYTKILKHGSANHLKKCRVMVVEEGLGNMNLF